MGDFFSYFQHAAAINLTDYDQNLIHVIQWTFIFGDASCIGHFKDGGAPRSFAVLFSVSLL
jgi:hypothetical protein